jgi:hypothetical protein
MRPAGVGSWGHPTKLSLSHLAFGQIGGYGQLEAVYAQAIPSRTIANTTCHLPRADAMHMFRDPYTGDLPWTGMTFGLTIIATWYWCTDQVSTSITCPPHCPALQGGLGGYSPGRAARGPCGPGGPGPSA